VPDLVKPPNLQYAAAAATMIGFCFTQVEAALYKVQLTGAKVLHIKDVFHSEMERGIHQQPSSLQMENTYIPELPDGTGE
jgi:hexokinase